MKSHYVPRLILKRFGERICLYDIQDGTLKEDVKPDNAYIRKNFYSDEVEDLLNRAVESQFANLFDHVLSRNNAEIRLKRTELRLVKKFLLVSIIRSMDAESFLQKEKTFSLLPTPCSLLLVPCSLFSAPYLKQPSSNL